MPAAAFISDLHLAAGRPGPLALFERLLAALPGRCERLYVLGDLFEYWVGDDDDTPPNPAVIAALAELSARGVELAVLHGNRDFLIGERFAGHTGAALLPDPVVVDLYGEPTLLMHGDLLCTGDLDYQRLRATVRSPQWQQQALSQPLTARRALAERMRQGSRDAMQAKAETIMDVEQAAVVAALRAHGVTRLIHGHTHRPGVHEFPLDGARARRTVLGDWYEDDSVLVCEPGGRQRLMRVEDWLGEA